MRSLLKTKEQYNFEIYVVVIAIVLYLFRTAIPLFKIPFFFIFAVLIIYSVVNYRKDLTKTLAGFINNFRLLLLLALILALSFLLSDKLYVEIFKDILNVVILFSLFLCSSLFIKNEINFKTYYKTFIYLIIILNLNSLIIVQQVI